MIDWMRVRDLRQEIGADDFDDVVALFLEEADEVAGRLAALTEARAIESELHCLKGSALNLGFCDLARICQSGERQAGDGDPDVDIGAITETYRLSRAAFLAGLREVAA